MNPNFRHFPVLLNAVRHQAPLTKQLGTHDKFQTRGTVIKVVPFHVQDRRSISSLDLNQGARRAVLIETIQVETTQTNWRRINIQSTLQKMQMCSLITLINTEEPKGWERD